MPTLLSQPTRVTAAGNKPKLIDEYIGRLNSKDEAVSVAHMRSPNGWQEPGQTPEFDEFTVVLKGTLRVDYRGGAIDVLAGQAVIAHKGEWVRYSTLRSAISRPGHTARSASMAVGAFAGDPPEWPITSAENEEWSSGLRTESRY